jgi:cytochrome c-type biogenesis protein CcmH/NrfG
MKPESLVYAAAGTLFGVIVGWILGAQQVTPRAPSAPAAVAAEAQPQPASPVPTGQSSQPPQLDNAAVQQFMKQAAADPSSPAPKIALGNLYFDAERYPEAAQWYEDALKGDPKNTDVSTDLGVSYYYMNQPDRALAQFDKSLQIDPKHIKTLLNVGIVRAFGKQDLTGAAAAWEQVVALSPSSPEGQQAKRALDAMKGAHPNLAGGQTPPASD